MSEQGDRLREKGLAEFKARNPMMAEQYAGLAATAWELGFIAGFEDARRLAIETVKRAFQQPDVMPATDAEVMAEASARG